MPFDPTRNDDITQLYDAIQSSNEAMKPFNKTRVKAYEQFVGSHYGENGSKQKVPVNMIRNAAGMIRRKLIATSPKAMCVASRRDLDSEAYGFQLAIDRLIEDVGFEEVLDLWVLDALMGPSGIVKVHLDIQDSEEVEGVQVVTGKPACSNVFYDDYFLDMAARHESQIGFEGDRYFVPVDMVVGNPNYDQSAIKEMSHSEKYGAPEPGEDVQSLTIGRLGTGADYRKMFELMDVWLPYEQLLITLAVSPRGVPPLRIVEWNGPKNGLYRRLTYEKIPGSATGLAFINQLMDTHESTNQLWNKTVRQGLRQKFVTAVPGDAKETAERFLNTPDGQAAYTENSDKIREVSLGGFNQANLALFLQSKQLANYMSGNVDSVAGLSTQSKTVGQDELLQQSSSELISKMQERTYRAVSQVVKDLAWYLHSDPLASYDVKASVPGTQITLDRRWESASMQGSFEEFIVDIEPYSLQKRSPEQRQREVTAFLTQILIPAMPLLDAQGIKINMEAFIKMSARHLNMPELNDLVMYGGGQLLPEPGTERGSQQPTNTTRRYERVSKPGASQQGSEQVLSNVLLGAGQQGSQMAQLGR